MFIKSMVFIVLQIRRVLLDFTLLTGVCLQAQVASRTPIKLLPMLGKRKRPLSGLPAQAAYAKHAKLLAVSAKVADPESKLLEPPEKLVKYYQGTHQTGHQCIHVSTASIDIGLAAPSGLRLSLKHIQPCKQPEHLFNYPPIQTLLQSFTHSVAYMQPDR